MIEILTCGTFQSEWQFLFMLSGSAVILVITVWVLYRFIMKETS